MGKNSKKKQPKTKLVFDDNERVEYLTGFRKRKMERKVKAREDMEQELRKAKIKIRAEQKTKLAQLYANDMPLPEIEHLIEPIEVHDIGDSVVTISSMDTRAIGQAVGLIRDGTKEEPEVQEKSESGSESETDPFSSLKRTDTLKGVKKSLEKERMQLLKKTQMYKKKQIVDKIKKQKSARRLNKETGKRADGNKKKKSKKKKLVGKRTNRPNQH